MTTIATSTARRRDWRAIIFRIMIVLIAISLFLTDGINIVAPWITLSLYHAPEYHATIERWHDAQQGTYAGILLTGSLLALLWRPREQPLLLQYVALTGLALAAIGAPFDPLMIAIFLVPLVLMAATYPALHSLLHFERHGAPSWPLLALSLTVAALLAPDVWRALQLQLVGADVHAHYNQWIGPVMLTVALVLAGLLAATRRPGWYTLGLLAGAALIYLGLVAIRLPSQAGSWGYPGGALATVGGWAFVGATLWEARHAKGRAKPLPSEPTAGRV